jgi:integrase/recombinase XerD
MGSSNKRDTAEARKVERSEELVDRFLDAIWMERGLSKNTLGAYRADLMTLGRGLSESDKSIEQADKADLLDFIAKRVESGAKPRSTARQLSSFRRFFRYIMREGMRNSDPTAEIEMPRIGRSLPKTLSEEEVDALLNAPNTDEPLGHRDRAMLELLYATGRLPVPDPPRRPHDAPGVLAHHQALCRESRRAPENVTAQPAPRFCDASVESRR